MLTRSLFAVVCLLPLYVQAADRAITEWTAMGDSYASGVGAGEQPEDDTNRCFRFPNAYPAVMQSGPGSLQPNPQKWNNVACSGNTAPQILDKEFLDNPEDDGKNGQRPAWGDKPEFVTITMGGNDIGILNLISTCILSFKLWGKNCEEVIQEGMDIAQSDELKANFTAVIEKAYTKGRSTPVGVQFQVFVTGTYSWTPFQFDFEGENNIKARTHIRGKDWLMSRRICPVFQPSVHAMQRCHFQTRMEPTSSTIPNNRTPHRNEHPCSRPQHRHQIRRRRHRPSLQRPLRRLRHPIRRPPLLRRRRTRPKQPRHLVLQLENHRRSNPSNSIPELTRLPEQRRWPNYQHVPDRRGFHQRPWRCAGRRPRCAQSAVR